jgi:DNA-directed RNA polymerase specialized sigma24 family protein
MDTTHRKTDLKILAERQLTIDALTLQLDNLRSDQTRLILAAKGSGCSWPDIAQALHVSPQAVQQRAQRAALVQQLADGPGTPE